MLDDVNFNFLHSELLNVIFLWNNSFGVNLNELLRRDHLNFDHETVELRKIIEKKATTSLQISKLRGHRNRSSPNNKIELHIQVGIDGIPR